MAFQNEATRPFIFSWCCSGHLFWDILKQYVEQHYVTLQSWQENRCEKTNGWMSSYTGRNAEGLKLTWTLVVTAWNEYFWIYISVIGRCEFWKIPLILSTQNMGDREGNVYTNQILAFLLHAFRIFIVYFYLSSVRTASEIMSECIDFIFKNQLGSSWAIGPQQRKCKCL